MKVGGNITVFAGDTQSIESHDRETKGNAGKRSADQQSKAIYAGNLTANHSLRDRIAQKKEKAQARALKIVNDAWSGDKKIDDELKRSRDHIKELRETVREARERIQDVEEQRKALDEQYNMTPEKESLMNRGYQERLARQLAEAQGIEYEGRDSDLTQEEWKQFELIEQGGYEEYYAEYREMRTGLGRAASSYSSEMARALKLIEAENAVIRGIREEKRKSGDPMLDAQAQADEVLEGARDEIVGMVFEEAKEHIDEEQEKREEQAEAIEEKKEEQEEILKERRKQEEELEELLKDMPLDEMTDLNRTQAEIRQEIEQLLSKMGMVADDIKGSMVDMEV
mgnify:CR=1 FL=1